MLLSRKLGSMITTLQRTSKRTFKFMSSVDYHSTYKNYETVEKNDTNFQMPDWNKHNDSRYNTEQFYKLANIQYDTGPVSTVILDWSGTTADKFVIAPAVIFKLLFDSIGVPITMKEARLPMGLRKDLHIKQILKIPEVKERYIKIKGEKPTQNTVDELFKKFVPMQLECLSEYSTLLPGTVDVVDHLRQEYNIKIGMTTGFTSPMVDILLSEAKKQGFVPDFSVAGDEVENGMGFRPTPFMIYKNLVNLENGYPINSVVKVDDTVTGVWEGRNAGCWTVGVYGWSNYMDIDSYRQWKIMNNYQRLERIEKSKQILSTSGAHYVIDTINALPRVIDDINERMIRGERP